MSGGSFGFVYSVDLEAADFSRAEEHLPGMIDNLRALGYHKAADDTGDILILIAEVKEKIAELDAAATPQLREAWKAVEWLCSRDWSIEHARARIEAAGFPLDGVNRE